MVSLPSLHPLRLARLVQRAHAAPVGVACHIDVPAHSASHQVWPGLTRLDLAHKLVSEDALESSSVAVRQLAGEKEKRELVLWGAPQLPRVSTASSVEEAYLVIHVAIDEL